MLYERELAAAFQAIGTDAAVEVVWRVVESSDATPADRCRAYVGLGTYVDAVNRSYESDYGRVGFFCAALVHVPNDAEALAGLRSVLFESDPALRIDPALKAMAAGGTA